MKRLMRICCFALLLALVLPVTARADVIYEPFDSFYELHRKECSYVGRSYRANGPNGTVTLYESPADPSVKGTYANGTMLDVSYSYQAADGVIWACCDKWDENITGWVPMEYLELIYDGISFREEHESEFVSIQMELDGEELNGAEVYFWEYPGSTTCVQVPMQSDYRPEFHTSYTDENGNEWAQCGYYMGIKGHWVNLSDPTAGYETLFPDIPPETEPAVTVQSFREQVDEIKPATSGITAIVVIAVAAVVVTTAILLIVLKKKR